MTAGRIEESIDWRIFRSQWEALSPVALGGAPIDELESLVGEASKPAFIDHCLRTAYALLPPTFDTAEATQMLLAIGYQESRFEKRAQVGGPARGFWQFEQGGGIRGVLEHHTTKALARKVLADLRYSTSCSAADCYRFVEHNDVLAAAFARLLLHTHPKRLPTLTDADEGWRQYVAAWRPGKPHPETWAGAWAWASRIRTMASS